jgi:hypothetical protein
MQNSLTAAPRDARYYQGYYLGPGSGTQVRTWSVPSRKSHFVGLAVVDIGPGTATLLGTGPHCCGHQPRILPPLGVTWTLAARLSRRDVSWKLNSTIGPLYLSGRMATRRSKPTPISAMCCRFPTPAGKRCLVGKKSAMRCRFAPRSFSD